MTSPQTKTVEFKIEGMDCAHCVSSVEGAVRSLPGISEVKVSLADNNAVVSRDPALVTDAAIIEAIEEVGFDVVK
ncbi:MAG: heavy-metal-associated domain-containing protein [Devosia sp.]